MKKEEKYESETSNDDEAGRALHQQSHKHWKAKNISSSLFFRSDTCAFVFLLTALIDVDMPGYVDDATLPDQDLGWGWALSKGGARAICTNCAFRTDSKILLYTQPEK